MKTKDEIRALIRAKRRGLDAAWVDLSSDAVAQQVAALDEYRRASVVAVYVALPGEVRADAILERCWEDRKMACVPAYRPDRGQYEFARMDREARMAPGPMRILEPDDKTWIPMERVDLVLVPGLAFDAAGGRVGHGGGHFDRTLGPARGGRPVKVGLAFEFQVFDQVPATETDVRMDLVVTEIRVIRTKSAAGAV